MLNNEYIKKEFLLSLKKEIEMLENKEKNIKLINFRINFVKNLEITARAMQLVAPFVLVASVVTGFFLIRKDIPFFRDNKKLYSSISFRIDNNGNISERRVYDDTTNSSVMSYYSDWRNNDDGTYSRDIEIYSIDDITYGEVVEFLANNSLDKTLGDYVISYEEVVSNKAYTTSESYVEAVIYIEDKNNYILEKESVNSNYVSVSSYVICLLLTQLIPISYRSRSSFSFSESVDDIKAQYKPLSVEHIRKKIKIKKDNYNRLMR